MIMKKTVLATVVIVLFLLGVISLTACDKLGINKQKEYTTRTKTISYEHFNTVSVFSSYGNTTEEEFDGYVKTADDMLAYYHKLFDIYNAYPDINNLKSINDNAGKQSVEVEKELIEFLGYCKQLYVLTNGKTNIMLGSVLRIWHDTRELASENGGWLDEELLPKESRLLEAATHTSIDFLVIDEEAGTVYITDPEASIDVGAIAKGYVVTKLVAELKAQGAAAVALNIGGNVATIGLKPDGGFWVTGITNPDRTAEENIICKVEIGETSVVTSGDYERFFISGDERYHHVIDTETLWPAEYFASVSVFSEDAGLADALSTALFCMSYEEGLALISSLEAIDVLWIYKDGTMKMTDGVRMKE